MNLTVERRKKIIELYPFLQPHNLWTGEVDEDYDYSYIRGEYDLPEGWFRLFMLYCKSIRPILVEAKMLNEFHFSQLKEKYGRMCLYNFGHPENMDIITHLYETYSAQVCHLCGKPASYKSEGWIESWCENCIDRCCDKYSKIRKRKLMRLSTYNKTTYESEVHFYTLRYIDREYKKALLMEDTEFYEYIVAV